MKGKLNIVANEEEIMELVITRMKKKLSVREACDIIISEYEEENAQHQTFIDDPDLIELQMGMILKDEISKIAFKIKRASINIDILKKIKVDEKNGVPLEKQLSTVSFLKMCLDAKQKAVKLYMNTFYGETGNQYSPFYSLELAGGITSAGQEAIKMVAEFVRKHNYHIKYGDTDSLYIQPPNDHFLESDLLYANGELTKEQWMSTGVRITMKSISDIRDKVNAFLEADNGSQFLKMAYEEVLYPVVFVGKKKYWGRDHVDEVNFAKTKLFIRGIDVIKTGQTELSTTIGFKIMHDAVNINNTRNIHDITTGTLLESIKNAHTLDKSHFEKTSTWKPPLNRCAKCSFVGLYKGTYNWLCQQHARQQCCSCSKSAISKCTLGKYYCTKHHNDVNCTMLNIEDSDYYVGPQYTQYCPGAWITGKGNPAVMKFVSRMSRRRSQQMLENEIRESQGEPMIPIIELPEIGEKVKFIVVVPTETHDFRGLKIAPSVGSQMEYISEASRNGFEIDYSYYFIKLVVGLCARFINSEDMFKADDMLSESEQDKASQKSAKAYLNKIVNGAIKGADIAAIGKEKKARYSKVEKQLLSRIHIDPDIKKILYINDEGITDHNFKMLIRKIVSKPPKDEVTAQYVLMILRSKGIDDKGRDIGTKVSTKLYAEKEQEKKFKANIVSETEINKQIEIIANELKPRLAELNLPFQVMMSKLMNNPDAEIDPSSLNLDDIESVKNKLDKCKQLCVLKHLQIAVSIKMDFLRSSVVGYQHNPSASSHLVSIIK
jgi:hypothetical protein